MIDTPFSTKIACGLKLVETIIYELILKRYNEHKQLHERAQKTISFFDKLYRKLLNVNVNDKRSLTLNVVFFTNYVNEIENDSFLKTKFHSSLFSVTIKQKLTRLCKRNLELY